jgi:hypothetical protein
VDSLRFKFETNKEYYGHSGFKFWSAALIKANDKTKPPTASG